MARTQGREVISTRQEKLAELARQEPKVALTTLAHHIDLMWMGEAWPAHAQGRRGGSGRGHGGAVRGRSGGEPGELARTVQSGAVPRSAVRRVHIPKPGTGNKTRPLGIPTLEDKLLQRAVLMVVEPLYEQDFLPCSYGFRPGRSAHQALEALWRGLMSMGGGWIIDLDIQRFFGAPGDRQEVGGASPLQ